LRFTENLENQDQTLIKEGTSVNVDNKIEPQTGFKIIITEMLPFLALNEHFTGGKVNNYLVQEIFIGGVLFIMYYKF
jgi:hypothetical protein